MAPSERKPRAMNLPYVPAGNGYRERNDLGRKLTFGYFQSSGIEGNIVGDDRSDDLYLVLRSTGKNKITLRVTLTDLTAEELDGFRQFLVTGFNSAREVAEARDKEARDAFEAGDDSNPRMYRAAPSLSIRTRPLLEYIEGIQSGSGGVSEVAPSELPEEPSVDEAG